MLCLSRKWTESITLTLPNGETILVRLQKKTGVGARVEIHAPQSVKITRTELLERGKVA